MEQQYGTEKVNYNWSEEFPYMEFGSVQEFEDERGNRFILPHGEEDPYGEAVLVNEHENVFYGYHITDEDEQVFVFAECPDCVNRQLNQVAVS